MDRIKKELELNFETDENYSDPFAELNIKSVDEFYSDDSKDKREYIKKYFNDMLK